MVLVLVVGPSGAGKDTLIGRARAALQQNERFVFVRRVVTRSAVAALEDHDTMAPEDFEAAKARGAFALSWDAHGLRYGLTERIDEDLARRRVVVANGSRKAIPDARRRYPDCLVVLVTAPREVRAARLAARGRESAAEVAARLSREGAELAHDVDPLIIDNSGDLERAVDSFIVVLKRLAA